MAALLLMGAVFTGCSDELWFQDNNEGTYTISVETSKGISVTTRALNENGTTLTATWTTSDHVYVNKGGAWASGSLQPLAPGSTATLKGSLSNIAIAVNDQLTLQFPKSGTPDYSGQKGTLADIAENFDYATATATVKAVSDGHVAATAATFASQQAIVKFTLKDKGNSDADINATRLTFSDGINTYTVIPTSATNVLYVAIPGFSNQTITLTASVGSDYYLYEKSGVSFTNGKYYDIIVKMSNIGALPSKFTINSGGGTVYFSKGNLQYQASTNTWRFAPNQYDMIGGDNANISDSYTGWIDLFGWGTGDTPTKATQNSSDYSTFTDWGTNAISNGSNTANMWSTLTKDEWAYLLNNHTKGWSTVNGVNGYVIRPDGISTAVASSYTASQWVIEEAAGSVFLPAACSRGGTSFNAGSWGDYWSTTPSSSDDAYYLYFHSGGQNPANSACRWGGRSVRLVYEPPYFQGAGTEADPYLISSQADWNYLAIKVNSGTSYAGKFFRQTANINVTTMVGNSSDSKPFSGTYDGDGKTLNLDLNTTTPHTAPFRLIANAMIKNVVTTGTVQSTSNHPSGLVGETDGTCTIQNCRVSANVGGASHSGGIVGHCWHANISIIGCVYSGTLSPASGNFTGGIIGWGGDGGGHTMTISNCLFAGSVVGSTSFHPVGIVQNTNNDRTVSNTYYTANHNLNNEDTHGNSFVNGLSYKGKFARSITAGTGVTVANAGAATVYDVSGITSYGTGILYGGVLYAGNGEEVNLTLSHAAAPTGFSFSQYTVSGGGSLNDPTSNSPTLTMTDANQTINTQWTSLTFNYTGAVQTFTVPATGYYTLQCYGAQGGAFTGNRGGYGGTSQLTYQLTQGDVLYIYVGGQGGSIAEERNHTEGGNGGWNGGGKGGTGVKHRNVESETPWSGGGGGGGATHIASSAIGPITSDKDFTSNHTGLLLIASGGGGGCNKGIGGKGGGAEGEKGSHLEAYWNIAWNNGTCSRGKDGMLSSWEDHSCEGCGGGGGGYVGGNTWVVQYNEPHQCYSGAGGSSWGETINGKGYSTTAGGATAGGNGKAVITWYGTTYPTE